MSSSERMPTVCVVMPGFKVASTIGASIQSVLDQDYPNIIVGVSIPGKDAESIAAVKAIDDPRIILVEQSGRGISDARNLVLRSIHADLYMFLDADDFMKPNVISKYVAQRLTSGEAGLRFGHYTEQLLDGSRPEWVRRAPFLGKVENGFERLAILNFVGTGSVMIDRAVVDAVGYFDEKYHHAEDWHYWMRIAKRFPIFGMDVVAYRYTYAKLARATPFPRSFFDDGLRIIRDVDPPPAVRLLSIICTKGMAALYFLRTISSRSSVKLLLDIRPSDFLVLPFAAVIRALRGYALV